MMLEHILLPETLLPYRPYPPAADRAAWETLPARAKLIARGEEYLGFSYPALTATDWLAFSRVGDRALFQEKYFSRRYALCALVLAECAEGRNRFWDDIANGLFALCEESGWQLPAHNNYVRDATPLPLPDTARPVLDLFACDTGALLAMALYLLGDKLEERYPSLPERIRRELDTRILQPYLHCHFWWMGLPKTLNWTVWCTQNVLLTAFLAPFRKEDRLAAAHKAMGSIDAFLSEYGEDGCCDEGAQYFRHAGLCLFGGLSLLDAVSGGAFEPVFRQPKIRNIARYILNVHVAEKYYVNFADCSPAAGNPGAREYLFGKRLGDDALCDFAAALHDPDDDFPSESNLFYRTQAAFTAAALAAHMPPAQLPHPEIFYESAGLFIARDETYCLAVKAGDNDDSHNHNDTGSVTLYKRGRPFLIDVGVETYTAKTFSARRYEIWTMQSSFHNLPEFDGVAQQNGPEFCASDVKTAFSSEKSEISMRLENAWPANAGLSSCRRRVTLEKGRRVVLEDSCEGSFRQAVLHLMLCEKPDISGSTVTLPGLGTLAAEGASDITCEEIRVEDPRLRTAWPETLYRLTLRFDRRITVTIV